MAGHLFVIAGPSGVGKSTLETRLLQEMEGLSYSVSATTRPPRPDEENGRDYYFVSREKFEEMIRTGKLAEWAEFYGHRYGTPAGPVEEALAQGRDLLIDVEVEGVEQLRKRFPRAILILILPPSLAVLKERLLGRQRRTRETDARARLERAEYELGKLADLVREYNSENRLGYDYLIVNDDLERAYQNLKAVVMASRLGPGGRLELVQDLLAEVR